MLDRQVAAAEASLAQHVEKANASLATKEAKIQVDDNEKIVRAHRVLVAENNKKLKLRDNRFRARCEELKHEIEGLKEVLTKAEGQQKAALEAKAITEAKLASLQEQVRSITSLVERARDEMNRARGRQHTRPRAAGSPCSRFHQ